MTIPPASTFMVERYLSPSAALGLVASAARVTDACGRTGRDVDQVRYLHSIFLPAEDLCFCVFQGPSAAAIQAVNDAATFAVDRITHAVIVYPPQGAPYRAPTRQTGERSS